MLPDVKDNIPEMKLYCYSIEGFNNAMKRLGYGRDDEKLLEKDNIAVISICCTDTNPEEYKGMFSEEHYFHNKSHSKNVLNMRFDDIDPRLWHGSDFDLDSAKDEDFLYDYHPGKPSPKALDWKQAYEIVKFVVCNLGNDFFIHCSAGASRSQAIVRFILDCFSFPGNGRFNYQIRQENPPVMPNIHVLVMLKKTITKEILYRKWIASFNPNIDSSLFGKNTPNGQIIDAFEASPGQILYQVEHKDGTITNMHKAELEII